MGWLRLVGSLRLEVSFAEYSLFYRALLQKRPIILRSLRIVATPYDLPYCLVQHSLVQYSFVSYSLGALAVNGVSSSQLWCLVKKANVSRYHLQYSVVQDCLVSYAIYESGVI